MSDEADLSSLSVPERLKAAEVLTLFDALDAAEALYESILPDDPVAGELGLGMVAYRRERYDEALARFNRVLEHNEEEFEALLTRGIVLLALKRPKAALADFERAGGLRPEASVVEAGKGRALSALGRHLEAEIAFRKSISRAPRDHTTYLDLARSLMAQGRAMLALEALDTAAKLSPESPEPYVEIASILNNLGGVDQAAELLRTVSVEALPDNPDILYPLALLELRLGRHDRVLALVDQLEAVVAEQADTLTTLAKLRLTAGDVEGAASRLERAVELDPQQAEAWYMLGQARDMQKRPNDSLQAYQRAARLRPRDWRAYVNMASLALDANDDAYLDKVEELLLAAGEVSTETHPEILFNLAQLYHRRGRYDDARRLFTVLSEQATGDYLSTQARRALQLLEPRAAMPEA